MTNANNTYNLSSDQSSDNKDQMIHYMLKVMELRVDELKNEINFSQSVFPLGVETDLTSFIKKTVKDPFSQLLAMKESVDSTVGSMITIVVKTFLESHRDKIQQACRTETGNNDLHFSIVLKEDNFDNRNIILGLLKDYKDTSLWDSFPIYFQFVPKQFIPKITPKEVLLEN